MIVASTGMVIFTSANTTGILTNAGPGAITIGVTGSCSVSDCTWVVTVAQESVAQEFPTHLLLFAFILLSFIITFPPFLSN